MVLNFLDFYNAPNFLTIHKLSLITTSVRLIMVLSDYSYLINMKIFSKRLQYCKENSFLLHSLQDTKLQTCNLYDCMHVILHHKFFKCSKLLKSFFSSKYFVELYLNIFSTCVSIFI